MNLPSNDDIKARLDFLKEISLVQAKLFRPGIESKFTNDTELKKFKKLRLQWTVYVETVEIDILSVLLDKLQENQSDFEDGIKGINQKIQNINDVVGFLNLIQRGLDILGQIIDLAI